jgi:hypothetical protein
MLSLSTLATVRPQAALITILAGVSACASGPSPQAPTTLGVAQATPTALQASSTAPVLLSCPAGQQALMRQVVVSGAVVPQVECVSVGQTPAPGPTTAAVSAVPAAPVAAMMPTYASAPGGGYGPVTPLPVRTSSRPQARRVAYDDDIVEYRRPARRSWQKSAVIIGSAAGAGAGVGAATGGKKGALIGAAVGGGAATVWDQVTRRQAR